MIGSGVSTRREDVLTNCALCDQIVDGDSDPIEDAAHGGAEFREGPVGGGLEGGVAAGQKLVHGGGALAEVAGETVGHGDGDGQLGPQDAGGEGGSGIRCGALDGAGDAEIEALGDIERLLLIVDGAGREHPGDDVLPLRGGPFDRFPRHEVKAFGRNVDKFDQGKRLAVAGEDPPMRRRAVTFQGGRLRERERGKADERDREELHGLEGSVQSPLPMPVARRFVIGGRVQGVGFRWFVHAAAAREGVSGYVRNLHDGTVEAFVEGENEAVARVERAVRSGPPGARVKTVNVIEEDAAGAYKTFTIEG